MIQKNILSIEHIALQLPDLATGLQFFHKLLGFKIGLETEFEGQKLVILKAGKVEIEMWEGTDKGKTAMGDSNYGVHHLAIQVKDLDAVMTYMEERGIKILAGIYEPTRGIRESIVQGPGGVRVQFVEQNVPLLIWRSLKGDFKEN